MCGCYLIENKSIKDSHFKQSYLFFRYFARLNPNNYCGTCKIKRCFKYLYLRFLFCWFVSSKGIFCLSNTKFLLSQKGVFRWKSVVPAYQKNAGGSSRRASGSEREQRAAVDSTFKNQSRAMPRPLSVRSRGWSGRRASYVRRKCSKTKKKKSRFCFVPTFVTIGFAVQVLSVLKKLWAQTAFC